MNRGPLERELEALDAQKLRGEIADDEYAARREALLQHAAIPAVPQRRWVGRMLLLVVGGVLGLLLLVAVALALLRRDTDDGPAQLVPVTTPPPTHVGP